MTVLSVNVNKIAWLRNAREGGTPDVCWAAATIIEAGAAGITVHPRPDQRHIRPGDVDDLTAFLKNHPDIEFNIEGNPFAGPRKNGYPGFDSLIESDPDFCAKAKEQAESLGSALRSELDAEIEPPYPEFFNSQIQKRIAEEGQGHGHGAASEAERVSVISWLLSPSKGTFPVIIS